MHPCARAMVELGVIQVASALVPRGTERYLIGRLGMLTEDSREENCTSINQTPNTCDHSSSYSVC